MKKIEAYFTAFVSLAFSWLGVLAVPVFLLVGCNVLDYGTGLVAAKYREEAISSYKGMRGIVKKVCQWLLIVVGWVVDQLLIYATQTIGWPIKLPYIVATVVAVWLLCNELISIIENIIDIGIEPPAFLLPLIKRIRTEAEQQAEQGEEEQK